MKFPLTAAALALAFCTNANAIEVVLDYRFDRSGYFSGGTPEALERRTVLEAAAGFASRLADTLAPIAPGDGSTWAVTFRHPSWISSFETVTVTDLAVPANRLIIFVGASTSFGSVLGIADGGSVTATGTTEFLNAVATRGQSGAALPVPRDFGPWGGSVWFNSAAPWYFGLDPAGLVAGRSDFLTTATHEFLHLLGIGDAPSWSAWVQPCPSAAGLCFSGPASVAAHGGLVPLDPIAAHWAEGVTSTVTGVAQETLMDPTTVRGLRELMTELDLAGLADIGWQVTPVPEPQAWALVLSGFALTGWIARRRRTEDSRATHASSDRTT